MIVIIDNYDSFTYNLFQYTGEFYNKIIVMKNDDPNIENLNINNIKAFIFSPGPGHPKKTGFMPKIIKKAICFLYETCTDNYFITKLFPITRQSISVFTII